MEAEDLYGGRLAFHFVESSVGESARPLIEGGEGVLGENPGPGN